jgi:SAM-dependent methyltransferase
MSAMFFSVWRQVAAGKTPMRALMNEALRSHTVQSGVVVDVGGGKNPSYRSYLQGWHAGVRNLDKQHGEGASREVDFERDTLPFDDASVDQVLIFNVLEHVYHHEHLVRELRRILKEGKDVLGFVPFLINYHPDPHDYFRYTGEALRQIFKDAGFANIEIHTVGLGPFVVNGNTLASFMPRAVNTLVWPVVYAFDRLLLALKPSFAARFPLGYLFILTK